MTYLRSQPSRNRGLSLIELLIGTTLGFLLIGAVVAVYQASKRSYVESEQVAALAENSRFAELSINHALRHAGFFGSTGAENITRDGGLPDPVGDCTGAGEAYDLNNFLFATTAVAPNPDSDATALGCITDAVDDTQVLVLKHVRPFPLYDADPDDPTEPRDGIISFPEQDEDEDVIDPERVYVIANHQQGVLFEGADTAPTVGVGGRVPFGIAWEYELEIYYIRNGVVPTLSRKYLQWDEDIPGMRVVTEDLVEGVEDLRLLFGFDDNGNGEIDTYSDASGVTDWGAVQSIEAFLLMRSAEEDFQFNDNRAYTLAGEIITKDDNYRRLVVHSRISLRNPRLRIRGGV